MIVRREGQGIRRYVHLSTGNYNPTTSRVYADMGLLTADPDIGADVSDLFNALTGYSRKQIYRKLLVSPQSCRQSLLERIKRETEVHTERGGGRLAFKLNALTDRDIIQALYRASQAGVRVDLQVRSMCAPRPGVPGVSQHISVTSVVGRFLEHARIYYFRNGGHEEVFVGSADLMPRNLDGRVEKVFPIEDDHLRDMVCEILFVHLKDSAQARRMLSDVSYERIRPAADEHVVDSQLWMLEHRGRWNSPD